ncbi:hypothetical protein [Sphingomonas sp. 2SG]|uniref:hypothetical protein n=1 Tax=Sphingomonas sp. 2SG TaxID=2502201 RepID=UPI0010F7A8A2|nr:hypothetical protein [Sphingomonas sp. 2SG]
MQPLSNGPRTIRPALLCLAAVLPTPALAQAWTTIRATPPAPAAYQVAKNQDDIRAGRRSGQLSRADARDLRRENARVAISRPPMPETARPTPKPPSFRPPPKPPTAASSRNARKARSEATLSAAMRPILIASFDHRLREFAFS